MSSISQPQIVIVGGSLAGLTLALACASRGLPVRVVERSPQRLNGGDSLSVSLSALAFTTGHDPRVRAILPAVPAYRDRHLTTWPALYAWLRGKAVSAPGITLDEGSAVTAVAEADNRALISYADGTESLAAAVIGADGYHSIVRRAIAPDAALARYAGYIVWRGLIEEQTLRRSISWPANGGLWIRLVEGYRLVAAVLPGRDGSMEKGRRQVTFAWFDVNQEALLRRSHCLTADGHIVGSLSRGTIETRVREKLAALVPRIWPNQWAEAVSVGVLSKDALSGAPIAEYRPEKLANGPLALVGDAAHVVSPMTGSGFATGVEDAGTLARLLVEHRGREPISHTLARYEHARLPYVRALVAHSEEISAQFAGYAAQIGLMDGRAF